MGFFSRLADRARRVNSLLCVGLDPHPADLSEPSPKSIRSFCMRLIDSTAEQAAAFKPNVAFFEAYGSEGVAVLKEVIAAVPNGIPVILDAKRGDIASTAEAYAQAAFQTLAADAVTVNPYLGHDAIEPFLRDPDHGVFLLCKTSNPGAADLQDLEVSAQNEPDNLLDNAEPLRLYEYLASLAQDWHDRGFAQDNLGLVVGATHPEALGRVRRLAPDLWILAPGIGAQGGDLHAALQAGLRTDGLGLLVPVSRAISQSANPRQKASDLRNAINRYRDSIQLAVISGQSKSPHFSSPIPSLLAPLADALLSTGCVKFGQFTLKSGLLSPIYLDLRHIISSPGLLQQVADAYLPVLHQLTFDRLAALPYAGLPIATAISLHSGWPLIYPRKEAKPYGTKAEIEGQYASGDQVVVIDDVATTGESKFEAIEKLTAAGLRVSDIVVLIDRQSGAAETLARAGYRLWTVFTLIQLLDYWEQTARVPADQITAVRKFLKS